eukprot:1190424-Prorocentrum_minimum.AAC.2
MGELLLVLAEGSAGIAAGRCRTVRCRCQRGRDVYGLRMVTVSGRYSINIERTLSFSCVSTTEVCRVQALGDHYCLRNEDENNHLVKKKLWRVK